MAKQASIEVKLDNFVASVHWVTRFKEMNGLVSRKITKFVTEKHRDNMADLFISAASFVHDTKEVIQRFGVQRVYNSDQSGFDYEFHSGRTIRRKGTLFSKLINWSID